MNSFSKMYIIYVFSCIYVPHVHIYTHTYQDKSFLVRWKYLEAMTTQYQCENLGSMFAFKFHLLTKRNHGSKKNIMNLIYYPVSKNKGTKNYCNRPKGLRNQLERAPLRPYQEILNIKMCNIKSLKNPWWNIFIH